MEVFKAKHMCKYLFFAIGIVVLASCGSDGSGSKKAGISGPLFTKMSSKQTGIDFRNDLTEDIFSRWNVLSFEYYYNGGGVGLGDINNDGLLDVFLSANTGANKLYLNKGDFEFEDISKSAGITHKGWSTGVSMADVNGDGLLDIYVCRAGPDLNPKNRENLLYINKGDNSFVESAARYGLNDPNLSTQAVFVDIDKDGDLDCYVMNESVYFRVPLGMVFQDLEKPGRLEQASGKLFKNEGNQKFTDITRQAGVLQYGYGLGLTISDFNNDSYPDIYVANDYSVPDMMWVNQKNGVFIDEIKKRTKHISWFSMGVDVADVDNDLNPDIAVVDMATGDHVRGKTLMASMDPELFNSTLELGYQRQHMFNAFQVNNGDGTFENKAGLYGVQKTEWSWASLLADFDNDGFKDYFISNGYRRYSRDNDSRIRLRKAREANNDNVPNHMRQELFDAIPQVPIENEMYQNVDGVNFKSVGKDWGIADKGYSNGAAYGDLDNDGDLDLIVNNIDDLAWVYRNNSTSNYLSVDLEKKGPKELTKVYIEHNGKKQMLEHNVIRGYISTVDDVLHFGLGDDDMVDKLTVIWPNRKMQVLTNVKANQRLKIKYADAKQMYDGSYDQKASPMIAAKDLIDFEHRENDFNDFDKEVLLPYKQSTLGPFIAKGDVNGDGREDIFVSGAKGQAGQIFIRNNDGSYAGGQKLDSKYEDMGAHFFDADGDKDLDLYVVSSGNDLKPNDPLLQDRLYINTGNGRFRMSASALPEIRYGGSRVKSSDLDGDGDLDLFVAGRLIPGNYPNPPRSYVLINEGGKFKDMTESWSTDLMSPGLVNDFIFTDLNGDETEDLVLTGEWMSPMFMTNDGKTFTNASSTYLAEDIPGWWFKMEETDIDDDGDMDIVMGNLGLNSKFTASKKKPFEVYANDFDGNGTCDIVLAKDYKGKTVPVRGRQCSSEQMPFIEEKFKTYNEFANASLTDILTEEKIKAGVHYKATNLSSGILLNEGGKYKYFDLPKEAQSFPITSIVSEDVNKDGKKDLILAGNIYNMEIETPRLDSGNGMVLINNGDLKFEIIRSVESGFNVPGDVKDMVSIKTDTGIQLLVANNNGPVQGFELK